MDHVARCRDEGRRYYWLILVALVASAEMAWTSSPGTSGVVDSESHPAGHAGMTGGSCSRSWVLWSSAGVGTGEGAWEDVEVFFGGGDVTGQLRENRR